MDPHLLLNGGNRAMWIDRFLRILEMEFFLKNWFQNTNLSIHGPSLLPTDPINFDTNDCLGCWRMRSRARGRIPSGE